MDIKRKDAPYLLIARDIEKYIKENNLKENDRLPSEAEFANMFFASRTCIRNALDYIIEKGLIYKIKGKGSFVKSITYNINIDKFYSFDVEMEKFSESIVNFVIDSEVCIPSKDVLQELEISENSQVYKIIRLRKVNGKPIMMQIHYLPIEYFPNLHLESLAEMPLYDILKEQYGIVFSEGTETFTSLLPKKSVQNLLEIDSYLPCLEVTRKSIFNDRPFELTISYIRGDKYRFTTKLDSNFY